MWNILQHLLDFTWKKLYWRQVDVSPEKCNAGMTDKFPLQLQQKSDSHPSYFYPQPFKI